MQPSTEWIGNGNFTALLESFRQEIRGDRKLPRDIQLVQSYIHEYLFSPGLNVQQLKRGCRIRDNNISSRFRRAVGLTIREYIESLRMEAAALLLRAHRMSIYDIGQAIGYDNPQTFYRAFARRFHCTPVAYRRTGQPPSN